MGILISRFRKKKNAEEQLEDLTQKIKEIEEFQENEEDKLRIWVRNFVIYGVIVWFIMFSLLFIPELLPEYVKDHRLFHCIVLFLVALGGVWARKLIIYYFKRKITKNKLKIDVYKKEKQRILDDVKETETYKVAKRILEKYDAPQAFKMFTPPKVSLPIPIPKPTPGAITPYQSSMINTDLRRRTTGLLNQSNQLVSAQKPPPSLVRPIVTENKGVLNRFLQKVVGDGPNERYALICRACGNHNGMALEEEFEFLSYRCAFCSFFNPARKQRAAMQSLLMQNLNLKALKNTSDSDSGDERRPLEITELEDSESESKENNTSGESKYDVDKEVVVEETCEGKVEEKSEPLSKTEVTSGSVSDEIHAEASQKTPLEKENVPEDNVNDLDYEIVGKEDLADKTEESKSKSEVSPMEVDDDASELISSVDKISLES